MEEHKSEIEIINRVLWLLTKSKGVADRYDAKIQLLAERKVRAMENNKQWKINTHQFPLE